MTTSYPPDDELKRQALRTLVARALDPERGRQGPLSDELFAEADRLIDADEDLRYLQQRDLSELSPYAEPAASLEKL